MSGGKQMHYGRAIELATGRSPPFELSTIDFLQEYLLKSSYSTIKLSILLDCFTYAA
jgi:hypothetical protein